MRGSSLFMEPTSYRLNPHRGLEYKPLIYTAKDQPWPTLSKLLLDKLCRDLASEIGPKPPLHHILPAGSRQECSGVVLQITERELLYPNAEVNSYIVIECFWGNHVRIKCLIERNPSSRTIAQSLLKPRHIKHLYYEMSDEE